MLEEEKTEFHPALHFEFILCILTYISNLSFIVSHLTYTYLVVFAVIQAQARCHRIGQSKAVKIYRLITRNSYEREMFDKASLKLGLDKAVLQSMSGRENANSGVQQLSKKEIEDLLRKGAYGALMDEEDEGSKFCEEDIDQILQRRTHTITIESEGKGSTFAKVTA